jgi:hypothetical protein
MLDELDILGDGFIPASSRPSSVGGGGNDNGVECRFGGVWPAAGRAATLQVEGEATRPIVNPTAGTGFGSNNTEGELSKAPKRCIMIYAKSMRPANFTYSNHLDPH